MRTEVIESPKGMLSRCFLEGGERIGATSDFLDLMGNCQAATIILAKGDLGEDFFKLKSGLAGEILQKVSNYRRRLVVLGDYSGIQSPPLRDFICESNATGKVIFASDLESAIALLK
jgi:hypothetical protein